MKRHPMLSVCGLSIAALSLSIVLAGCPGPAGNESDSSCSGKATYVKPADQGGKPVQEQESQEDLKVQVSLAAAADFDAVNQVACNLSNGNISASASASETTSTDGSYQTFFATAEGSLSWSNPVCGAVKNTRLDSVTSLTLDASIPNTESNCTAYCQAKADAQCSGSLDQATCIANVQASCKAECTVPGRRIHGHGQASLQALSQINGQLGGASDRFDANVDLVFDSVQ